MYYTRAPLWSFKILAVKFRAHEKKTRCLIFRSHLKRGILLSITLRVYFTLRALTKGLHRMAHINVYLFSI